MLVCGDVFDQFAPSAEAERIVYDPARSARDRQCGAGDPRQPRQRASASAAIEALSTRPGSMSCPRSGDPSLAVSSRSVVSRRRADRAGRGPAMGERTLAVRRRGDDGPRGGPEQGIRGTSLRDFSARLCGISSRARSTCSRRTCSSAARRIGGGERELTIGDLFAIAPQALPMRRSTSRSATSTARRRSRRRPCPRATPARCCSSTSASANRRRASRSSTVEPGQPAKVQTVALTGGRRLLDVAGTLEELRAIEVDPEALPAGDAALRRTRAGACADDVRTILPGALEVRLDYERERRHARAGRAAAAAAARAVRTATIASRTAPRGRAADEAVR